MSFFFREYSVQYAMRSLGLGLGLGLQCVSAW